MESQVKFDTFIVINCLFFVDTRGLIFLKKVTLFTKNSTFFNFENVSSISTCLLLS